MEVGLGPCDLMLDGDPVPPQKQRVHPIFRSLSTDDLVDWNSGVSVRPYVHPQKVFPISIPIWCVGRPRPHMRTIVTSTRSKVKVKVTELPKLRKLYFSRSLSSAVLE